MLSVSLAERVRAVARVKAPLDVRVNLSPEPDWSVIELMVVLLPVVL